MLDELADALELGEGSAGPDDHRDADPGQVLSALNPTRSLGGAGTRVPVTTSADEDARGHTRRP